MDRGAWQLQSMGSKSWTWHSDWALGTWQSAVPEGSLLWWCEPPLPHTFSETVFAPICLTGLRAFLREKIGRVAVLARLCDRWKPDVSRQSRRLQCQSGSWKVSGGLLLGCLVGVELSRRKFYFCPAVGSLPDLKSDDWACSFSKSGFPKEGVFCNANFYFLGWQGYGQICWDRPFQEAGSSLTPSGFLRPEVLACPPQGGAGNNSLQENLDSLGLYRMRCSEHGGWEAGRQHGEALNLVLTHF